MIEKLKELEAKYDELSYLLADPEIATDYQKYQKHAKGRSELEEIVQNYRKYKSVEEYKEAVDATGLHFAICCAWPISKFMRENGLAFPDTFELCMKGYEGEAKKHGLRRISLDKAERTDVLPHGAL